MSSTRRAVGFASLTATALVAGLLAGPFVATAAARPSSGLADRVTAAEASRSDARAALARAQAVFAPVAARARSAATPVEATLVLRDLALAVPSLGRAGRQAAHAILARPGDPTANDAWGVRSNLKACNARLCVRWTTRGADAPPDRDRDRDGKPDQVEFTLKVVNAVWSAEVGAMGFRPPLTDQRGSYDSADDRFDVYLSDLPNGLYGYCTPDDTRTRRSSSYAFYDVAAYCVLDDDYARSEFTSGTPASNLRTTAAHEFHHAVQGSNRLGARGASARVAPVRDNVVTTGIQHLDGFLRSGDKSRGVKTFPVCNRHHFHLLVKGDPGLLQGLPEVSINEGDGGAIEQSGKPGGDNLL